MTLLAQCDLKGADAWTVACECASLGDPTMLDDLKAGLKIHNITALIYENSANASLDRPALKLASKSIDENHWRYKACKQVCYGCYTKGHEVLTPDGWIKIEDLTPGVKIMVYGNQNRCAWFEAPSRLTAFPYTGTLYNFEGHSYSSEVTGDHKIPYTTNQIPKHCLAAEMAVRKACDLPTAAYFEAGKQPVFYPELVAAFQADGSKNKKGHITFGFRKRRKVDRVCHFLDVWRIPYRKYLYGKDWRITISDKLHREHITKWGKSASAQMLTWTPECLDRFLNELEHWDGHRQGAIVSVSSVDKNHLEWLDTLLHLRGRNGCMEPRSYTSGFGSTVWRLHLNHRTYADRASMEVTTREVIDEPVYCPTVSTGFIMVRRKGKIYASGNSFYGMAPQKMMEGILKMSYGTSGIPVYVSPKICDEIQRLAVFTRYPGIKLRFKHYETMLLNEGRLVSEIGHIRTFQGRKADWKGGVRVVNADTHREALATKPQLVTTYVNNLALRNCWYDQENYRDNGSLRVRPLLTVHDSGIYALDEEDKEFAKVKLPVWYANEITIAGVKVTIPYSGTIGVDWGMKESEPV